MTIFKTYEGFFDFFKKKNDQDPEDTEMYRRVMNFIETEDIESISDIFVMEGVPVKKISIFLEINGREISIDKSQYNVNVTAESFGNFIKKSMENSEKVNLVIKTNSFYSQSSHDKITDVCNVIQSLFDLSNYKIYSRETTTLKFAF